MALSWTRERNARSGTHYDIDYFLPSPDGKLVAYGISPALPDRRIQCCGSWT